MNIPYILSDALLKLPLLLFFPVVEHAEISVDLSSRDLDRQFDGFDESLQAGIVAAYVLDVDLRRIAGIAIAERVDAGRDVTL
jgi:hypothetical protein